MSRKIKLIWDFHGQDSERIAIHHEIHLKEYIHKNNLLINISGTQIINEMYSIAYIVVTDEYLIELRDTLKPHRGEIYTQ